MKNKMEYARSLSTKEEFTKELAKGFIEIYKRLNING
jgi:urate oxidase